MNNNNNGLQAAPDNGEGVARLNVPPPHGNMNRQRSTHAVSESSEKTLSSSNNSSDISNAGTNSDTDENSNKKVAPEKCGNAKNNNNNSGNKGNNNKSYKSEGKHLHKEEGNDRKKKQKKESTETTTTMMKKAPDAKKAKNDSANNRDNDSRKRKDVTVTYSEDRRAYNRMHAKLSRKRRKDTISNLEDKVDDATARKETLQGENLSLTNQIQKVFQELLDLIDPGDEPHKAPSPAQLSSLAQVGALLHDFGKTNENEKDNNNNNNNSTQSDYPRAISSGFPLDYYNLESNKALQLGSADNKHNKSGGLSSQESSKSGRANQHEQYKSRPSTQSNLPLLNNHGVNNTASSSNGRNQGMNENNGAIDQQLQLLGLMFLMQQSQGGGGIN